MKARFPQNRGGVPTNMQQLAQQAQKIQESMESMSEELDVKEYTETSGGGAVSVTVTGKNEIKSIEIKPEVVDPDDIDMLADMIMAAANEAIRKAVAEREERMSAISGGFSIPGMF